MEWGQCCDCAVLYKERAVLRLTYPFRFPSFGIWPCSVLAASKTDFLIVLFLILGICSWCC